MNPQELIHALYDESQGITDVAVKVFLLAQIYAMSLFGDEKPMRKRNQTINLKSMHLHKKHSL